MQGSVFWMAPEVVQVTPKGQKCGYNDKVDTWSLGCVVLEMWTGCRPWKDKTDTATVLYKVWVYYRGQSFYHIIIVSCSCLRRKRRLRFLLMLFYARMQTISDRNALP